VRLAKEHTGLRAVLLVDMRGQYLNRRKEHRRIIGESKPQQEVGDQVNRQQKVRERGKENAFDASGGMGIDRRQVSSNRIRSEGHLTDDATDFPAEAPTHVAFLGRGRDQHLRDQFLVHVLQIRSRAANFKLAPTQECGRHTTSARRKR